MNEWLNIRECVEHLRTLPKEKKIRIENESGEHEDGTVEEILILQEDFMNRNIEKVEDEEAWTYKITLDIT